MNVPVLLLNENHYNFFLYLFKMFQRKNVLLLLPVCLFLYACPYESPKPLDEIPSQPVDTGFLGYWYGIIKDHSDVFGIEALDISKHSDSLYQITRYGKSVKGNMIMPDTAHFTGYLSNVLDLKFMNIESSIVEIIPVRKKAPVIKTTKIYYLAFIELQNDTLTVKMIADNFAGKNPNFKNPGDVRQAVTRLLNEGKNIYDDLYKLSYRRWPRPK
jgi:hypothetical protein